MAKEGDKVTIVGKKHPHYGETGTVTDEYIKTTKQYIVNLDDCMHGTINTAVSHDDIGEEVPVERSKGGRPTIYSDDITTRFCFLITTGLSVRKICQRDDMPNVDTIYEWLSRYPEFSERYTKATEARTDAMAEDILDIADDGMNDYVEDSEGVQRFYGEHVQRARLRVETRKWLMTKMKPKKYGDRVDLTSDGKALPAPIFGGAAVGVSNAESEKQES